MCAMDVKSRLRQKARVHFSGFSTSCSSASFDTGGILAGFGGAGKRSRRIHSVV